MYKAVSLMNLSNIVHWKRQDFEVIIANEIADQSFFFEFGLFFYDPIVEV